jgi:trigger factor
MQSEIREISPVLVEVTVQVPWDHVEKHLEDTYKEFGKTARVRGFRPGKVPKNVMKQVYGRQVAAQVTGSLVEQGLMHAVQEHDLHIVSQPEMERAPALEHGRPLIFKAKVEVRPKIEQVKTEGLEAWRRPIDIPAEDIDAEVERLRHQHAEIQVPDPLRPAQPGDLITIDYTVEVEGKIKEELGAQGRQVEISGQHLLPALEEGLLDMQPGDEKAIEVHFEEDHPNLDLRGKTATFGITAKQLHEKLLPDLDDEFAKDCGDYETLLELRLKIREGLEAAGRHRAEAELKDQLIDSLIAHNDIPVPPSMVQQQQQMMMYELAQLLQLTGQRGAPGADFFAGLEERAKRRVQAGILLGSLARQEGIEVTDADLDAKFHEIAERTGKHVAKVRADYQGAQRDALESQLLEEKVMALLADRATIKEGEPPEAEPKDEEPAEDEGGQP